MSSLGSGLNASFSGIKNYGYSVSVAAGNIAKADAVAGKESQTFVLGATNNSQLTGKYTPCGVTSQVVQYVSTVGNINPAQVNTFMALAGQGFFVVKDSPLPQDGTFGFTRVGNFQPDANGYLKNSSGQTLMVWPTDREGHRTNPDVSSLGGLVPASTKKLSGAPSASTSLQCKMTLPANAQVGTQHHVPVQVIDSLGINHQVILTWEKTVANPQTWRVRANSDDAATIGAPYTAGGDGMVIIFDNNGNPATINGANAPAPANNAPDLQITWNSPAAASTLTFSCGTIGNADGVNAVGTLLSATQVSSNGRSAGRFTGIVVDDDTGFLNAQYDNGLTLPFGQIPIATFKSPNGLVESSGGVYFATLQSGDYQLTQCGTNGSGKLVSSSTEQSTIDTTEQFTKIILNQTYYQSNAKVISIINEMQKVTNQMV